MSLFTTTIENDLGHAGCVDPSRRVEKLLTVAESLRLYGRRPLEVFPPEFGETHPLRLQSTGKPDSNHTSFPTIHRKLV
jgi:hypothetical protein